MIVGQRGHVGDEPGVHVRHVRRTDEAVLRRGCVQGGVDAPERSAARPDILKHPVPLEALAPVPDQDDLVKEGAKDSHHMVEQRCALELGEHLVPSEPPRLPAHEHDPRHERFFREIVPGSQWISLLSKNN